MNIIDAGDYILPTEEYRKIYASESYDAEDINIVKRFVVNLMATSFKTNE